MNEIYVFDLDGVITDPNNSQVDGHAIALLSKLLKQGSIVAVNTGRSFEWVRQNIIHSLADEPVPAAFTNFIMVCEKGGESVLWSDGEAQITRSQFALTDSQYMTAKNLLEQNSNRLQTMFWDNTKQTMATIEKIPAADLAVFHQEQKILVSLLTTAFGNQDVRIDTTTIATDVEAQSAGKYAGAELIYEWVTQSDSNANVRWISFGDSVSDYEMARCFADHGSDSVFVYLGATLLEIAPHSAVRVLTPSAHFSIGLLEYFDTNK